MTWTGGQVALTRDLPPAAPAVADRVAFGRVSLGVAEVRRRGGLVVFFPGVFRTWAAASSVVSELTKHGWRPTRAWGRD
jgi:hypothetical protein